MMSNEEYIKNLEQSKDLLYDSLRELRDDLYSATVWQRIKWVFTGVIINK